MVTSILVGSYSKVFSGWDANSWFYHFTMRFLTSISNLGAHVALIFRIHAALSSVMGLYPEISFFLKIYIPSVRISRSIGYFLTSSSPSRTENHIL